MQQQTCQFAPGHQPVVELLLRQRADVHAQAGPKGLTALLAAASKGSLEVPRLPRIRSSARRVCARLSAA